MIAVDTSALSSYFKGERNRETDLIDTALGGGEVVLPPVVVTEMLSDPQAKREMLETVAQFHLLPILEGYWNRAGDTRRLLAQKRLKAKVADALIAQSCIDHNVLLITRDGDFRHFAKHCGLKLA
jgi:predicted nucleic acid-binding protein